MTSEIITKKTMTSVQLQEAHKELQYALIAIPNNEEALVILKKYYSKGNPLLNINEPLPALGSFTPLCMAVYQGATKIVEWLLANKADPNYTIDQLAIPLHIAAGTNRTAITYYLLKAGANVNQLSKTGQSALMRACETQSQEVVKILVHNNLQIMPDIMCETPDKKTCLDYALQVGNLDSIRIIEYVKLQKGLAQKQNTHKRTKI
jgi:ankyrin repeat protein